MTPRVLRRAIWGAAALVVAGCGGRATASPAAVRTMVMEACAPGGDAVELSICRCALDRLADTHDASELEGLDGELRNGAEAPAPVRTAVLDCLADRVRLLPSKQSPPGSEP